MANKSLFASITSMLVRGDWVNEAGGPAYKYEPKHALAQMAATGAFGTTYYADAKSQLDQLLKLIDEVNDNEYLAKLAVYSRERAYRKDMPAALLLVLSKRDTALMHRVFDRVVDNGRVLRTVFQMTRSGQFGRPGRMGRGLSSSLQRAFQRWFNEASVSKLLSASIGNDPKLICIDLQPHGTTQAAERADILNIGDFSDTVFNVISSFLEIDANRFVREVEAVEL